MRVKNCYVIWVNYFDKSLSRKEGRKIAKNKAISKPRLEELVDIVDSMGYKVFDKKEARYPSSWWIKSGYVVIDKSSLNNSKKKMIIDKIAKEWRRRRGG